MFFLSPASGLLSPLCSIEYPVSSIEHRVSSEGEGYVALCPEVDVASQGDSVDEARANLQ
jgi:predicted RNase H-like HicB family nuclease